MCNVAASHYTFHRAFHSEIKIIKGNLAVTPGHGAGGGKGGGKLNLLAGQLQTYIMLIRQYNQNPAAILRFSPPVYASTRKQRGRRGGEGNNV